MKTDKREAERLIWERLCSMRAGTLFTSGDVWNTMPELKDESCYEMTPLVSKMLKKAEMIRMVVRTGKIVRGHHNINYVQWKRIE